MPTVILSVGLVNGGEFCTFGFLYSDGLVAGPVDGLGAYKKP